MDDAERQRTMDFILQQQAQFSAGMQRNEEQMATLRRVVVMMAGQFRKERSDLKERVNALVGAQMRSEERQARTEEWQARMEESFARSDARMTRLEEEAERSSAAIAKLAASTDRNREDIATLARVVSDLARARNGGKESA